ncbi:hypothetical protein PspCFBP13508_17080 [Pseudomonas sp. CFBP13508]|nr:hypothetical protein PspCFBP13508_17080 [Pseudomonas sp. CFBP13508]
MEFALDRGAAFASRLAPTFKCSSNVGASLLAKRPDQLMEISELPVAIAEAQQIQHAIQPQR